MVHDLNLNIGHDPKYRYQYSTRFLFPSVWSNIKMLPYIQLPNIGAFIVDEITDKYVEKLLWHWVIHVIIIHKLFFLNTSNLLIIVT